MPLFNTQDFGAFVESGDQEIRFNVSLAGRTIVPDITTFLNNLTQGHTISSLAIGPQSDIDQLEVEYALGAPIVETVGEGAGQRRQSTILSVGYPLDFGLRGPIDINIVLGATPVYGLSRSFKMPGYSGTMLPEGDVVAVPFTGMTALQGQLIEPSLELIAGYDGRRLGGIGTVRHAKRFPTSSPAGLQDAVWRFFVPVFGRKHLRVFLRHEANGAVAPSAFAVQMAYVTFFDGNGTVPGTMREMLIAGATANLAAFGAVARYENSPQGREDFFEVRVTKAGVAADQLRVEVVVAD